MGNPKEIIYLHIWDVSSVEVDSPGFHELLCDGLDGVFFVFNVHRVSSIAAVDAWRTSLSKYISASEVPCYLLSHKADMLQKRVMTSDDIEAYARVSFSYLHCDHHTALDCWIQGMELDRRPGWLGRKRQESCCI